MSSNNYESLDDFDKSNKILFIIGASLFSVSAICAIIFIYLLLFIESIKETNTLNNSSTIFFGILSVILAFISILFNAFNAAIIREKIKNNSNKFYVANYVFAIISSIYVFITVYSVFKNTNKYS